MIPVSIALVAAIFVVWRRRRREVARRVAGRRPDTASWFI